MKKALGLVIVLMLAVVFIGCQTTSTGTPTTNSGSTKIMKAPWSDCGVGSWVEYKILLPTSETINKKETLIRIEGNNALVETSIKANNEWRSQGVEKRSLKSMSSPIKMSTKAIQTDIVKIGNKKIKCRMIIMKRRMGPNETTFVRWMSHEVPGGIVRRAMGGKIVKEVVAFEKK